MYSYFRSSRFCTMDASYQSPVARRWPRLLHTDKSNSLYKWREGGGYALLNVLTGRKISWAAAMSAISEKRLVSAEGYLGRCSDWLQAGWPRGTRFSLHSGQNSFGPTQHPSQWVSDAISSGVKRLECEADHRPPSSAEVKNEWNYTFSSPYVFVAWCLAT
jgi:hypothetical protein